MKQNFFAIGGLSPSSQFMRTGKMAISIAYTDRV